MPFKSKSQMKAAFGGFLGPQMKAKAPEFAKATSSISNLPSHAKALASLKKKKP